MPCVVAALAVYPRVVAELTLLVARRRATQLELPWLGMFFRDPFLRQKAGFADG